MRLILHFILLLMGMALDLQGQSPYVQVVSGEKGFGYSQISMLMEDHQGILWAATQLGLLRFDGLQTTTFLPEKGNPNSISNEYISYLFEDKNHYIWLATRNGLTSLDPSRKKFTRYQLDTEDEGTLPNNRIFSLMPDTDSTFFVNCDRSGLTSFNSRTGRATRLNPKLVYNQDSILKDDVWVLRTFLTQNERILTGTSQGLFEYNRTKNILTGIKDDRTAFHELEGKANYFCSQEGFVWFTSKGGCLHKWIPNSFLTQFDHPELCRLLQSSRVRIQDFDSTQLLISTAEHYLLINKLTGEMQFLQFREDQKNLLRPDQIIHCLEISSGVVMFGTSKGQMFIINPLLQQFKYKEVIPENLEFQDQANINDFLDDPEYQKRYISVIHDTFFYVENLVDGTITSHRKQFQSNIANKWLMDDQGRLWLCNGSCVLLIDRVTQTIKTYFPETPALNLFRMVDIGKGIMLVGSFQQGLYLFEPDRAIFKKFPEEKGWKRTQVYSMKYDQSHHAVWIGTVRNGLFRLDIRQDTFIQYQYDSRNPFSLGGDWVRDITIDSSGDVWFATDPTGISRFDYEAHPDSAFINLSMEDGLPSNYISGLGTDQSGLVWMTSLSGVAALNTKNFQVNLYGSGDGLTATRFRRANLSVTQKGLVLIGTQTGYFYFQPGKLISNEQPPKMIISDILVFDQSRFSIDQQGNLMPIRLQYKENYITVRFSVINYTESEKNMVRYMLEGFDENWITRTGIHEVNYTKVPPGEYTFRILAANNDGVWNEQETRIPILIRPPYWQTTWFYILFGSLIGGLVLAFYNFKLRQSIKQNKLVAEREWVKAESERQLSQLEMKALRAQMNPHFIFNCLNSINRFIVVNDNEAASAYLTKFARLIRQVLDNSRGEKVVLSTEIETLKLYIEMEALRFVDKFEYQVNLDPALDPNQYMIQPMLIQPYVENAIWHGLMHRKEKGVLKIYFSAVQQSLQVIIEDNGIGRQMAKTIKDQQMIQRKSHGMKVTAERMSILSKKLNVRVEALVEDLYDDAGQATGTKVNLTLPLEPLATSVETLQEP